MKAQISEIFQSIQGEGIYAGVKQVFVRFFDCNLQCAWCDTPAAMGKAGRSFQELDVKEVSSRIVSLGKKCHSVSLTGGEPLLQAEFIQRLLPVLKKSKMPVYLETNGTLYKELETIIHGVDIVAMDIKLPSSTGERAYWAEHKKFLKIADRKEVFIKAVVASATDKKDMLKAAHLVAGVNPDVPFIIQPNFLDLRRGVMKQCQDYQDVCSSYLRNVRVLPQMHKFMKIR